MLALFSILWIYLLYIIYKCIPADDILMMILCISPLSPQYCSPPTGTVLDITFPHDLILQNSANILHHRVVTSHRGEGAGAGQSGQYKSWPGPP